MSTSLLAALLGAYLTAAPTAESSLLAELERLDRELVASEARLVQIETERASVTQELATNEAENAAAKLRADEALRQYERRLRALARMPAGARVALLGGVGSLTDYLQAQRVLRWVAGHDRKLHDTVVAEMRRYREAAAGLAVRRARLETLIAEGRAQRDVLATRREERMELLKEAIANRERIARERSLAQRELVGTVTRLTPAAPQSELFARNRGKLPWPAAGTVGTKFGEQVELGFGTVTTHSGLDILAKAGSTVQAVATGRVVFAGWLKGYGQVVILDHGGDYHTVSAHLAAMSVTLGQEVPAGAPIGTVGDTGSLTGSKLYFEIRQQGTPLDPLQWLRR